MFDLLKYETKTDLTKRSEDVSVMAAEIQKNLPIIHEAVAQFGKSQSQFMDNFLTVSHPTPLRNARQALAEMNRCLSALREAQYTLKKKQLLVKRLTAELALEHGEIKREELQLEIDFESSNIASTMLYVEGSVRAVANYMEQYKQILKTSGYTEMTEADFEKEEEQYHIMKAFDQAVCAARARAGIIDEGNHIYFSQLGVNGCMAQDFVTRFFEQERAALSKGGLITCDFLKSFLVEMSEYFRGCTKLMAESKGMTVSTPSALLTKASEKSNVYQLRESV